MTCRFCLANGLLADRPVWQGSALFVLGPHPQLSPEAAIIVPLRHVASPFGLMAAEWADMSAALDAARSCLAGLNPDGWTIGWNVGAVAGQEIMHAHLHVIARFAGRPGTGRGVHAALTDKPA